MSRLTHMSEAETSVEAISQELARLETLLRAGTVLHDDDVRRLGLCSKKATALYQQIMEASGSGHGEAGPARTLKRNADVAKLLLQAGPE